MTSSYCATIALTVCLLGTIWRMGRWFTLAVGPESRQGTCLGRARSAAAAVLRAIASRKTIAVLGALAADVVFQRRIFKQSILRWCMHMGLFYGVVLLVGLHALDNVTLARLAGDYASTRYPFMLLRNLLGLLLFMGLAIALIRRWFNPVLKRFNTWSDRTALLLVALILISGVALEAVQIISSSIFDEMVDDYMGTDAPDQVTALKAYWARNFAVVFQDPPPGDAATLALGGQVHADYCAACHSRPTAAVMAYPLAKAIKPLAARIDQAHLDTWLWYFHYLVSCLALALLPFGKFFHLVSVPASLALKACGPAADNQPLNRPARRAVGLDACTHCGVCSRHCSVAPIMAVIDNPNILPSEKLGGVRRMAAGRLAGERQAFLAQGGDICTACGRCTDVCPSGIDLQDLWLASQADLLDRGFTGPHGRIGRRSVVQWAEAAKALPSAGCGAGQMDYSLGFTRNPETFWACVQCTTCTTVCPVVAASDNPRRDLDFTPQQVMNLMRLELREMALGCGMVWKCVTCYKCQEHCPQGVPVADVLYELRNEACRRLVPAAANPESAEADP
jgi:succinate dehydrogenase/fumarate reductase-like Fe-S protein/nitrate reductase gamma subunit